MALRYVIYCSYGIDDGARFH